MALQATDRVTRSAPTPEKAIGNPVCRINYTRDTWVKLMHLPSDYAFDEAMLLCQESQDTWVTWVPSHGEVVLDRSHFYC